ncbi:MAG: hypothetical protein HA492_05680 [Candidatus Verstraetearchaeota archaeon]|nr:hypothetical protein [Candidatus Verstraetearchaeota archaeon]
MRMLFMHCESFNYVTTIPTRLAEPVDERCKKCQVRDAMVVFVTVERMDECAIHEVAYRSCAEILSMMNHIGKKVIVLFPFSHLSNDLADPKFANKVLDEIQKCLNGLGYTVYKAPFGWEKKFSLTCKGHPLAQALRVINPSNKRGSD